jgi:hypothetical protein
MNQFALLLSLVLFLLGLTLSKGVAARAEVRS